MHPCWTSARFFQGNDWGEIRQRPPEFVQEGVWTQWDEVSHFTVLLLYLRPDLFIVCLCRGDMMVPVALDSNAREEKEVRLSVRLTLWSSACFCISMSTSHSVVVTWYTFFLSCSLKGLWWAAEERLKAEGVTKENFKLFSLTKKFLFVFHHKRMRCVNRVICRCCNSGLHVKGRFHLYSFLNQGLQMDKIESRVCFFFIMITSTL